MEKDAKDVFKLRVTTVKELAKSKGVSNQAIHYAIEKDLVDYVKVGFEIIVVFTEKTKRYAEKAKKGSGETVHKERMEL